MIRSNIITVERERECESSGGRQKKMKRVRAIIMGQGKPNNLRVQVLELVECTKFDNIQS